MQANAAKPIRLLLHQLKIIQCFKNQTESMSQPDNGGTPAEVSFYSFSINSLGLHLQIVNTAI